VAAMAGRGAHDLVFTAPGGGLRNTRFRSRVFDRAKKETRAIGSAGARPVAYGGDLAIASGASVKTVQSMPVYASTAMTLDVYSGLSRMT
jgi:hypothetical protein